MSIPSGTCRRISAVWATSRYVMAVIGALVIAALPAFATFSGANGAIAYVKPCASSAGCGQGIVITNNEGEQIVTSPPAGSSDSSPAWSPDGAQLAFVRVGPTSSSIEIVNKDGSGERDFLNDVEAESVLTSPAWSPDGRSLAFIKISSLSMPAIYTIQTDGSNLREITAFGNPDQLAWSSQGDLGFVCDVPSGNFQARGICVLSKGELNTILIQVPGAYGSGGSHVQGMAWSPDGQTIVLTAAYFTCSTGTECTLASGHLVPRTRIFRVNKDGTGLAPITAETPDACPEIQPSSPYDIAAMSYIGRLAPSPDGKWIAVYGDKRAFSHPGGTPLVCPVENETLGIWVVPASGGDPELLRELPRILSASDGPDWQPIPQALTVNIFDGSDSDGHHDPLKGMKVELLDYNDPDKVIEDKPINTIGGTYVFESSPPPGDYFVQATLVDQCADPCTPAFDILYAPDQIGQPVYVLWKISIKSSPPPTYDLNFDNTDSNFNSSNLNDSAAEQYLDDMAAIYFRTRQYVDWIKANVTPDTGPIAHFYTFAMNDPGGGPLQCAPDPKTGKVEDCAYSYLPSTIVFDQTTSEYANRAGSLGHNNGPMNDEWHEFTHHLYSTFVNNTACRGKDHAGYSNPDTCWSMSEGFATFLPTYAAQEILEDVSGQYADLLSLNWPLWAWDNEGGDSLEDYAVAELFWDLTTGNGKTQSGFSRGLDGTLYPVTYTNSMNLSIQQLWAQLISAEGSAQPGTVFALRQSFGYADPTIDLDYDHTPDVSPIDIPFLLHGFYPIDTEQTRLIPSPSGYAYDVGYAQRGGYDHRDGAVGETNHGVYNAAGAETGALSPRPNMPRNPNANIALTVLDASGAPLDGAKVNMTIDYPGGQSVVTQDLASGSGALVHLELPPYFNYLLPAGAPLPACDPAHDLQVKVILQVEKYGQTSTESPTFDNCTYYHAVAAATGPAALSYTLTVPVTGTGEAPTTTVEASPVPGAGGWNNSDVTVNLTATAGAGVKTITYSATGAQLISDTAMPGSAVNLVINTEGKTTITYFATDDDGNQEAPQQLTVSLDKTAPSVSCGAPDSQWHPSDVSIACTANDGTSGLENPSDANFTLSTAVPAGTEDGFATTGSHSVCDVASNCTTAGPIGPIRVDEKPPTITITVPAGNYAPGQEVSASYKCTDAGSGVATCVGNVSPFVVIDTSTIGTFTFTVNATDKAGNAAAPQTTTYSVNYDFCFANPSVCQSPAQDVTSLLAIKLSGFTFRTTYGVRDYLQTVTITNTSNTTINGPISLVFDNLSSNVTVLGLGDEADGSGGTTSVAAPAGSPYIDFGYLSFADTGFVYTSLAPGQSASIQLAFEEPSPRPIRYHARVLAGVGGR